MNEVVAGESTDMEATAAEVAEPVQASAGTFLREAREAAGVDLAALAVALKVSVKKLEALESDRLDLLPDAVFARALAASVCRTLKVDVAPVLAQLPQTVASRLDHDEVGLNAPFQMPGDVARTPFLDRLSRPMVLAALAVLLGALVLILFPSSEQRAEIGAIVARPPAAATELQEPVPVAAEPVPPAALPATPATTAPAAPAQIVKAPAANAPAAKVAAPPPAATPAAVKPAAVVTAPTAVAPAASGAAAGVESAALRRKLPPSGVVVFKTSASSWIEVTDAKGVVQFSRVVEPGDPVGASGALPLSVTVGRADVTEVTVRGKPFPLEGVARQGVARFEVK